jgi:hypothetical protein
MAVTDPAVKDYVDANLHWLHQFYVLPVIGAVLVVIIGKSIARKKEAAIPVAETETPAG